MNDLIPPHVKISMPLAREATDSPLAKSMSLEKLRALSLVSATLEIEYASQFFLRISKFS